MLLHYERCGGIQMGGTDLITTNKYQICLALNSRICHQLQSMTSIFNNLINIYMCNTSSRDTKILKDYLFSLIHWHCEKIRTQILLIIYYCTNIKELFK